MSEVITVLRAFPHQRDPIDKLRVLISGEKLPTSIHVNLEDLKTPFTETEIGQAVMNAHYTFEAGELKKKIVPEQIGYAVDAIDLRANLNDFWLELELPETAEPAPQVNSSQVHS